MSARLVGLVGGVVVSSGFIYSLRRNIEKDLNIHRENLADIDYELKTAFLPEHEQAIIDDLRPKYREVSYKPHILTAAEEANEHFTKVIVPDAKSDWNSKLSQGAKYLNNIKLDFANWSFKW